MADFIETTEEGEVRLVTDGARRRFLPRRRKQPSRWSDDEIWETVRACYTGRLGDVQTAAVVLHCPARLIPRSTLREQRRVYDLPWPDYQWWGFGWSRGMWEAVLVGEELFELVQAHSPQETETEAREAACMWVQEGAREVSYSELPIQARSCLTYAVRHGPSYFF